MSYTREWVEQALPLMFSDATVQLEREAGMPGSNADPRTANDASVAMMDLRIAWERCAWIEDKHRQAALAVALCGDERSASAATGVPQKTINERKNACLEALVGWLNSTKVEREVWRQMTMAA